MVTIIDITVSEAGSDINAIEEMLAETYERVEKQHISVVERKLGAIICNRHAAVRFRIAPENVPIFGVEAETIPRIRNRTTGLVHVDMKGDRYVYGPGPA